MCRAQSRVLQVQGHKVVAAGVPMWTQQQQVIAVGVKRGCCMAIEGSEGQRGRTCRVRVVVRQVFVDAAEG